MKILTLVVFTVAALCAAAVSAEGQQRVLLSFDNAGHHVSQIVRVGVNNKTLSVSSSTRLTARSVERGAVANALDLETLIAQLEPSVATLMWLDENGSTIRNTTEPDPRISHAPTHVSAYGEGRVGESEGAWLVTGPGSGKFLTILLPADTSLALAFEQWTVDLTVK